MVTIKDIIQALGECKDPELDANVVVFVCGDKMPRYEVAEDLSEGVKDLSRARQSLIEGIEAMMFYDERADATKDRNLKSVMEHNRDDEKEHAALLLEWLRRHDRKLDKKLRGILFSKKEIRALGD